jgi:hypothetical protein
MRADQPGEGAVNAGLAPDAVVMREDGDLLQVVVVLLEAELRAYDRVPPAGIDEILRAATRRTRSLWA